MLGKSIIGIVNEPDDENKMVFFLLYTLSVVVANPTQQILPSAGTTVLNKFFIK
jgi:hypothetical protein